MPNLGVVVAGDFSFTVGDVPGLIEGGEGRGLGFDFLRHIERCAAIVHVIDCATYEPGRDPLTDLEVIEAELKAHGELEDRPRLVALNKIDIPDARRWPMAPGLSRSRAACFPDLNQKRRRVAGVDLRNGPTGQGRDSAPPPPPKRIVIRPKPLDARPSSVSSVRPSLAGSRREAGAVGTADRLLQLRGCVTLPTG